MRVRDYRFQTRQRMNLALDRQGFDALFSVTHTSTATELLITDYTEKLDEHCPIRSVKRSSKDPPCEPTTENYASEDTQTKIRHESTDVEGNRAKSRARLLRTLKAQNKPGSASWWETTNYMLEKEKRCSTALDFDVEEMEQNFENVCRDKDYQPPRKTEVEEDHHWQPRRISFMKYYAKREALHLGKMEYPPGCSARMHKSLPSH